MGNICCGNKLESRKPSALEEATVGHADASDDQFSAGAGGSGTADLAAGAAHPNGASSAVIGDPNSLHNQNQQEQQHPEQDEGVSKALREEQARLELIVQATGRRMVAVRSTRGSTGYYDQGFAAALAQHLEQTTEFPERVPVRAPPPPPQGAAGGGSSSSSLYSRLAAPQWEGVGLGVEGSGLAGCAGKNPAAYFDDVAESFLDQTIPKKERLFAGAAPFLENLL